MAIQKAGLDRTDYRIIWSVVPCLCTRRTRLISLVFGTSHKIMGIILRDYLFRPGSEVTVIVNKGTTSSFVNRKLYKPAENTGGVRELLRKFALIKMS